MKRIAILAALLGTIIGVGFAISTVVRADDTTPMTEAHIARIRANCVSAQTTLTQLHASDALMRVNRGQIFQSISTRLMVPFNGRIAKYTQQNVTLVELASDYDNEFTTFSTNYQQYEEAMSRTLQIDCQNQPVSFYDSVSDTRNKRQATHDSVLALQKTIQDYSTQFELFAKNFQDGTK
jgi:hypothetical protein